MKMKLPPVESKYPQHISKGWEWVSIAKYQRREWFAKFAYDWVTDKDIDRALARKSNADLSREWQDIWTKGTAAQWRRFHAERIAALVRLIQDGKGIKPVSVDIMYGLPIAFQSHACSYIPDGHHRIRALMYLGYKVFPATLSGVTSEIAKVIYRPRSKKVVC